MDDKFYQTFKEEITPSYKNSSQNLNQKEYLLTYEARITLILKPQDATRENKTTHQARCYYTSSKMLDQYTKISVFLKQIHRENKLVVMGRGKRGEMGGMGEWKAQTTEYAADLTLYCTNGEYSQHFVITINGKLPLKII